MDLKEAETLAAHFMPYINKQIIVEDLLFMVNEIHVQLSAGHNSYWKPVMVCTEIDENNGRKRMYDVLFTLSYDLLKVLSAKNDVPEKYPSLKEASEISTRFYF